MMNSNFLQINCRADWSLVYCDVGNIFMLLAEIIGFTVMLPQIYQVWNYHSVDALHVLWPTSLITAKFIDAFYVFATEKRVFFKLSAVYFPIVYAIFLSQFWFFTKKSAQKKLSFTAVCLIVWASLFVIELSVIHPDGPRKLKWISIVIYSVKVFPQLMLNIQLRTTFGQSSISIFLYCIFATFSYLASLLLEFRLEFLTMYYISCTLAYINGMQVLWYPRPLVPRSDTQVHYGTIIDSTDYSVPFEDRHFVTTESVDGTDFQLKNSSSTETSYTGSLGRSQTFSFPRYFKRLKEKPCHQLALLGFLLGTIGVFTCLLGLAVRSVWTILCPISIFAVLILTSLSRDYAEGLFDLYFILDFWYRLLGL